MANGNSIPANIYSELAKLNSILAKGNFEVAKLSLLVANVHSEPAKGNSILAKASFEVAEANSIFIFGCFLHVLFA